ncbi:hypothetical protein ACFLU6_04710 [Acidobacteriota bacterium]
MAEQVSVDEVAEAMYAMVKDTYGKKDLKAGDLTKAMIAKYGADRCDKPLCKKAIRQIIDGGKCVYSYFGGSFITLPPEEGVNK